MKATLLFPITVLIRCLMDSAKYICHYTTDKSVPDNDVWPISEGLGRSICVLIFVRPAFTLLDSSAVRICRTRWERERQARRRPRKSWAWEEQGAVRSEATERQRRPRKAKTKSGRTQRTGEKANTKRRAPTVAAACHRLAPTIAAACHRLAPTVAAAVAAACHRLAQARTAGDYRISLCFV